MRRAAVLAGVLALVVLGGTAYASSSGRPEHGWSAPLPESVPVSAAPGAAERVDQARQGRASDADLVSRTWSAAAASRTGIPERAVRAYAGAALATAAAHPGCHLGWTTLAALGAVESGHGSHDDSALGDDGVVRPGILGPRLDGTAFDAMPDTDGGRLDSDTAHDRAVGPLQFLPDTWARWGADGDGDGVANPQQLDDAALAAARYLCASGDLAEAAQWRAAVFSYNHLESYVDQVAETANAYTRDVR